MSLARLLRDNRQAHKLYAKEYKDRDSLKIKQIAKTLQNDWGIKAKTKDKFKYKKKSGVNIKQGYQFFVLLPQINGSITISNTHTHTHTHTHNTHTYTQYTHIHTIHTHTHNTHIQTTHTYKQADKNI